jgi:hypothetical protein
VFVDETGTNASLFSFFVAQDRLKKAQSESPEPIRNIEMPSATISKPIEAKSSTADCSDVGLTTPHILVSLLHSGGYLSRLGQPGYAFMRLSHYIVQCHRNTL